MTTPVSSVGASASRRGSLSLSFSGAFDLLDDVDFESTMVMLELSDMPTAAARRRLSSVLQRGAFDQLDLSLSSLAELFPASNNATDSDALSMFSDDQLTTAPSLMTRQTPGSASTRATRSPIIKSELPHSPTTPLSPTMDSFLRDSWSDVHGVDSKNRRTSTTALEGLVSPPRRLSVKVPQQPMGFVLATTTKPTTTKAPTQLRAPSRQPRRAKQCIEPDCPRRAQSNNRCKTHGGGARCQHDGCDKSSQGGGLCRAHGGGKKCGVAGCTKGTQRLGLCYLHGGIRRCIHDGCKKKDRGNGYCISHGGGRRCLVPDCERSVRKGNACQTHQGLPEPKDGGSESPFQIIRGHTLHNQ